MIIKITPKNNEPIIIRGLNDIEFLEGNFTVESVVESREITELGRWHTVKQFSLEKKEA